MADPELLFILQAVNYQLPLTTRNPYYSIYAFIIIIYIIITIQSDKWRVWSLHSYWIAWDQGFFACEHELKFEYMSLTPNEWELASLLKHVLAAAVKRIIVGFTTSR